MLRILEKVQEVFLVVSLSAMLVVVLIATFCRYTQIIVLEWPDELTRYLMMWMVFIGCGLAAAKGSHFAIEAVYVLLPHRGKRILTILKTIVTDLLLLFILYLSINMTQKQLIMGQTSPAMKIPMWFMYLAIPVGCLLMMIQGTVKAITDYKSIGTEGST